MSTTPTPPLHGSYLTPSLDHATVGDVMHAGILSVEPDASLTDVARIMATHHVHCVAVMGVSHEEPECLVWGIITDLDLVRAGLSPDAPATARGLANHPLVTVDAGTPLREAGEFMAEHRATHLVVRDASRMLPVGVLSTLDVAGVLAWGEG
jgi:CBS domain-containing protein